MYETYIEEKPYTFLNYARFIGWRIRKWETNSTYANHFMQENQRAYNNYETSHSNRTFLMSMKVNSYELFLIVKNIIMNHLCWEHPSRRIKENSVKILKRVFYHAPHEPIYSRSIYSIYTLHRENLQTNWIDSIFQIWLKYCND